MDEKKPTIMDGAGPFLFEGNEIGILMIHGGGGGTCADLKPLAEDLHTKGGYTIRVPLLPGFGRSPEILKNTHIEEWISSLKEEITILMHSCDKIFVGGHSMGGLLTLILAVDYDFDGIFIGADRSIRPVPPELAADHAFRLRFDDVLDGNGRCRDIIGDSHGEAVAARSVKMVENRLDHAGSEFLG